MGRVITTKYISEKLQVSQRSAQRWKQRLRQKQWGYLTLAEFFRVFEDDTRIELLKELTGNISGDERRRSLGRIASGEELLL